MIAIFVDGAYNFYTRGYNFPIRTTQKKSVSKLGVIFWGSPLFLALSGHSHVRVISILNFGPFSTILTQNDNDPEWQWTWSGQELRRNKRFYVRPRSVFFWPKMGFNPKNHPKFLKKLIFIWEKATFFFEQLFLVVARAWLGSRSGIFLGPKAWFLAKKSNLCHRTPILVKGPFVTLGGAVHFPPWEPFLTFGSRVTAV